jgi:2-polyprenyl-3-methyl-5-hydroxy-6-metoxy-1,4-benzoquinol methylase
MPVFWGGSYGASCSRLVLGRDLLAAVYPFMFPETSYRAAGEQVGHLLALTGLTSGTVLDLACRPGRYTIPLAQRGFRVTGVDCTPFLLDKARAYAATAHVDV